MDKPTAPSKPTVASLLPWLTDLIVDLGLSSHLVLTSHDCDAPDAYLQSHPLPHATRSRLGPSPPPTFETALGFHAATSTPYPTPSPPATSIISTHLCAYYTTLPSPLLTSRPDLLLTELLPAATPLSPSPSTTTTALRSLLPSTRLLSLPISTTTEAYAAATTISRALHAPRAAPAAIARCRSRLARVSRRAPRGPVRLRCAVVQWADPLFVAGGWVPEVVEAAGGVSAFCGAGRGGVGVEAARLAAECDLVVFAVCAVGRRGAAEVAERFWRENWGALDGWRGRAVVVDAVRLFSRASLGVIGDTAEVLEEIVAGRVRRRRGEEGREAAWAEFRVGEGIGEPEVELVEEGMDGGVGRGEKGGQRKEEQFVRMPAVAGR